MGIDELDRNPGNVLVNKFTKKPIQIDFGVSDEAGVTRGDYKQTRALRNATTNGLEAAGLFEEAEIFNGLVSELLEKGDLTNAWDVAKQGFSRLQKINAASLKELEPLDISVSSPLEGTSTRRKIIQEMIDRGEIPF